MPDPILTHRLAIRPAWGLSLRCSADIGVYRSAPRAIIAPQYSLGDETLQEQHIDEALRRAPRRPYWRRFRNYDPDET